MFARQPSGAVADLCRHLFPSSSLFTHAKSPLAFSSSSPFYPAFQSIHGITCDSPMKLSSKPASRMKVVLLLSFTIVCIA